MIHSLKIIVAALLAFSSLLASPAFAGEKCKCRFNGGYVEEGQTACIKTSNGLSLARCEKVLNNSSWTVIEKGCPTANLIKPDNENYSRIDSEMRFSYSG